MKMLVMLLGFVILIVAGTVCLIIFGKGTTTKVLATTLGTVGMVVVAVLFVFVLICAGIASALQTCSSCGNPSKSPQNIRK
jgi:hypothetical protein